MLDPRWCVRLLAVGTCALVLTGCGSPEDGAGAGPEGANDADVGFAGQMVPHHQQAVWMADLAEQNADDARVLRLAKEIKYALEPEIETMRGWLAEWGEPVPSVGAADQGPGAASDAELTELEHSYGRDFDRTWLELMLAHHRGSVLMARAEVEDGEDGAARALAEDIVQAQRNEMQRMRWLLQGGLDAGGGGIGW